MTNVVSATGSIQAQQGGSGISFTWVILGVLILFWVFMIFQSRRRKQQQVQQRASMDPGTRVMLTSGIIGTLVERTADHMIVEVADGVRLTVVPGAIARTLPALDEGTDSDTGSDAELESSRGFGDSDDAADAERSPYGDSGSEPVQGDTVHDDDPHRRDTGSGSGDSAIREGR
jgi:preprotein translocase subunit YajC